jgi:hypothetical protein
MRTMLKSLVLQSIVRGPLSHLYRGMRHVALEQLIDSKTEK